jgi:hypothetical protein
MTSKKTLAVGCLLMGLVGGIVSNWLLSPVAANAQEGEQTKHVVTASCFRVTDEEGRTRAELGLSAEGDARLRLYDRTEKVRVVLVAPATGEPRLLLLDKNGDTLGDGPQSTSVAPRWTPAAPQMPVAPQTQVCSHCGGSGNGTLACFACKGTGLDQLGTRCSYCNGRGFEPCSWCKGTGRIQW